MFQPITQITIKDINLATALATMSVPFARKADVIVTEKGTETLFFFEEKSSCGKYKTIELMQYWHDYEFVRNNPEHPFSYVKAFSENRKIFLDKAKSHIPFTLVHKDGRTLAVRENTKDSIKNTLIDKL